MMLTLAALLEVAPIATGHLVIDEFAARFVYFYGGYALSAGLLASALRPCEAPLASSAALSASFLSNGLSVFQDMAEMPGVSLFLGAIGTLASSLLPPSWRPSRGSMQVFNSSGRSR
ncbi:MAG: hypothetical protein H7Y08_05865 [Rhizobiaceae bacterium]|nr:hypothetical protein [Rhizobiaceae bacterium]